MYRSLSPGEKEVCQYIVERYDNYSVTENQAIKDWVEQTKKKLDADNIARIIEERDC